MTLHVFHAVERVSNHRAFAALNGYFVASKTIRKIKTENTFLDGTAVDPEKNMSMIQLFHIFATSLPNGSDRIGSQNKALRGAMRDV